MATLGLQGIWCEVASHRTNVSDTSNYCKKKCKTVCFLIFYTALIYFISIKTHLATLGTKEFGVKWAPTEPSHQIHQILVKNLQDCVFLIIGCRCHIFYKYLKTLCNPWVTGNLVSSGLLQNQYIRCIKLF